MAVSPSHLFQDLIGSASPKTTLLVGAGLSFSLVETPSQIVKRLAAIQHSVESSLGLKVHCAGIDATDAQDLYRWAGDVFNLLKADGISEGQAKRKIADGIGVTSDPTWQARAKMPLRGNTARHRVIARLARENRWLTIWSLNWDSWLESALRSVGIEASASGAISSTLPKAWIVQYKTWVPGFSSPKQEDQTVPVIKPHGCVDALLKGSGLFVLTEDELQTTLPNQPQDVVNAFELKGPGSIYFSESKPTKWH